MNELMIFARYIQKLCVQVNRQYKGGVEDKLFQSPKRQGKDYSKALVELKSYIMFFISDQNINTGREMIDIKNALDHYINYKGPK